MEKLNTINKTARLAGLWYLMVTLFASFAGYVSSQIIIPGDAASTIENILSSESLFRFGFVSDLIGQVMHIVLVLALYKILEQVNQTQAKLMASFGLIAVPITMLNLLNSYSALIPLSNTDYLNAIDVNLLHAQAMHCLEMYKGGFFIVQIFWGLWLFPLGYLVFKSGFLPKFIGVLLIIAGIGYLVDFSVYFLLPKIDLEIKIYTFIGEIVLTFWLLIKGVNIDLWNKQVLKHN